MAARKFLVPIDLTKLELQNAAIQNLSSAPAAPVKGQLYFNTTDSTLYWCENNVGPVWTSARGGGAGFPGYGTVTAETSYGLASNNGAGTLVSRTDHTHGSPALTANPASTQAIGDAAIVGVGTTPARDDHKHGLPAFGAVSGQATFGLSAANGAATTLPRSDHVHGTPTHVAADHSTIPLSSFAAATGAVNAGGQLVTNVGTPVSGTDAANKNYVDNAVAGLSWKQPVRVATAVAGTLASSFANGQTVDGIVLATGDRILIKNQAAPAENGIYTVNAAGAPTRATDSDTSADLVSAAVFVSAGTTGADTSWTCTNDAPITIGTTGITFVQFSGGGTITAGAGLTSSGNTLDAGAGLGIAVNADNIQVDRVGGNNRVPLVYSASVGDGSSTAITVTHNLNAPNTGKNVIVQLYDASTGAQVEADVVAASANTLTINFAVAPAAAAYRCMVLG